MSNDSTNKGISPVIPLLLLAGGVLVAYTSAIGRTAYAATQLKYEVSKIQIYRLKLNQPIVFRIWVQFTNLTNTDIVVQHLYAEIYLNFNGSPVRIGTLNPNQPLTVPANQTKDMAFDIEVKWLNLGNVAINMFSSYITGGNTINLPDKATVVGEVQAEFFTIPFEYEAPFNSTPIEQ